MIKENLSQQKDTPNERPSDRPKLRWWKKKLRWCLLLCFFFYKRSKKSVTKEYVTSGKGVLCRQEVLWRVSIMVQNRKKHRIDSYLIIHVPRVSEWVSEWVSERTRERSGARKRSQQGRASERVSGRASGPVLTSMFLVDLAHSAMGIS